MRCRCQRGEPMCETSEKSEKLIPKEEIFSLTPDVGRRILEVFGYQDISTIVFRLKSNSNEIKAVLDGRYMPSAELLLGIQRTMGVSIDWLLTGVGEKYLFAVQSAAPLYDVAPPALWGDPLEPTTHHEPLLLRQ